MAKQQEEETQKAIQPKVNEIVGYYERQIEKTNSEAENGQKFFSQINQKLTDF
jgi:hypothetical protein